MKRSKYTPESIRTQRLCLKDFTALTRHGGLTIYDYTHPKAGLLSVILTTLTHKQINIDSLSGNDVAVAVEVRLYSIAGKTTTAIPLNQLNIDHLSSIKEIVSTIRSYDNIVKRYELDSMK